MSTSLNRRDFIVALAGVLFLQAGEHKTVIKTKREWEQLKNNMLAGMQEVMGQLPSLSKQVEVRTHATEDLPLFTRVKISYLSEPGDYVPAYLLIPKGKSQKLPAMVCLHQTTNWGKDEPAGIGGDQQLFYAKELAERGYVCIAPDYPYLGENTFDPYANGYVSGCMKGIVNHIKAVDILESLPEVNSQKIGAIGHSLGAHNSLFLACFDERIKAIVSSCGFTTKMHYAKGIGGGDLTGWSGPRYMPRVATVYKKDPTLVPFDFPEVLMSLAPRPMFINAPLHDDNFDVQGVKECVSAASSVYRRIFKSKRRLVVRYPDAGHSFPKQIKEQAYNFLDKWLS